MADDAGGVTEKLSKPQRRFLELALRDPDGCPWHLVGLRQRSGMVRMFDAMKARGWFDGRNCITRAGRDALSQ